MNIWLKVFLAYYILGIIFGMIDFAVSRSERAKFVKLRPVYKILLIIVMLVVMVFWFPIYVSYFIWPDKFNDDDED